MARKVVNIVAVVCLMLLVMAASRVLAESSPSKLFDEWRTQHGRTYKDEIEKAKRFKIFHENLLRINKFNQFRNNSYTQGLNMFSDMTNEEFLATHTLHTIPRSTRNETTYGYTGRVPASINWARRGAVNPIQYQGKCGSCWAFAAVAAVESSIKIRTGRLWKLSEQELVYCDHSNLGCTGGWIDKAFNYMMWKGIATEYRYPYTAANGFCNLSAKPVVRIRGYADLVQDENEIVKAVAMQPVAFLIAAGGYDFQNYNGGIFSGYCGQKLNHYVVAVGYGTTPAGTDYWLVRNSWGTWWGEGGYMRITRNTGIPGGLCGLALGASFPIA